MNLSNKTNLEGEWQLLLLVISQIQLVSKVSAFPKYFGNLQIETLSLTNVNFIAVYHKLRYNTSISDPCHDHHCSHLCLIVPGGFRCACPDGSGARKAGSSEAVCDAGMFSNIPSSYVNPSFQVSFKNKNQNYMKTDIFCSVGARAAGAIGLPVPEWGLVQTD